MWVKKKREPVQGEGDVKFGELPDGAYFVFKEIEYRKVGEDFAKAVRSGKLVEIGKSTRVYSV